MTWNIERRERTEGVFPMLAEMCVELGTREDWDVLHGFHYRASGGMMGPRYYKVTFGKMLAGVVVLTYPRGLLKDRHRAMPAMRPEPGHDTKLSNVFRFKWLNHQFALNARTVNDTLFRGIGLGYRMLNIASRMDGREYIEIQSSMSKFNEFAFKAGFQFVKPLPPKNYDAAMTIYRRWWDSNPIDQMMILEEFEQMHPAIKAKALQELRDFYWSISAIEQTGNNRINIRGDKRTDTMDIKTVVKNVNQASFSTPLYGIYKNPDHGRKLPPRIPVLAFDRQPTDQPLILTPEEMNF